MNSTVQFRYLLDWWVMAKSNPRELTGDRAARKREAIIPAARAAFVRDGFDAAVDVDRGRGRRVEGDRLQPLRHQGDAVHGRHRRRARGCAGGGHRWYGAAPGGVRRPARRAQVDRERLGHQHDPARHAGAPSARHQRGAALPRARHRLARARAGQSSPHPRGRLRAPDRGRPPDHARRGHRDPPVVRPGPLPAPGPQHVRRHPRRAHHRHTHRHRCRDVPAVLRVRTSARALPVRRGARRGRGSRGRRRARGRCACSSARSRGSRVRPRR